MSRRPISSSIPTTALWVHGRFLPEKKYKDREDFFESMKATKVQKVDMAEIDVLMLRSDPSLDAQTMPWAAEAGILFGREAAKRGVIVLNDPDSLGKAINKLYFQSFPSEARAETLITRTATTSRPSPRSIRATSSSSRCRDRAGRGCSSSIRRTARTSTR